MKKEREGQTNMSRINRKRIYNMQVNLFDNNVISILMRFLNTFLSVIKGPQVAELADKIFQLFHFVYFRNSINISCFVQKSSLQHVP